MYRPLVYNNITYNNFLINECGLVKNIKTNYIYKFSISKTGYYVVYLPMGKRSCVRVIRIHKAVAEVFLPNPLNKPMVHHKDGNKLNPKLNNLEWVTSKENKQYSLEEAKKNTEYFNNRKLTYDDVVFIRENKGMISIRKLAKMFNISHVAICAVSNGNSYKEYN